ncbi:hypothetical protein RHMOL_Rhmol03G0077000 [Rhododendron molle]|uniref:Uncharacterized protein n=2 Tax=Rhododendron molle TaxID=49168 RepID=A0ACC0PC09_RHOML|nr:hypothetical protein RHMOL_Rhmol03G0077000 [Rhododendron molle]KAI8562966.1 hypothetical protein RHMOL_Rhmol03G0077000 [Rhododendron molle]
MMSKNGVGKNTKKQNGNVGYKTHTICVNGYSSPDSHDIDENGENLLEEKIDAPKDISSESDEPLWSKRNSPDEPLESSEMIADKVSADSTGARKTTKSRGSQSAVIDSRNFDAHVSGGLARNAAKCCSLSNGDIMVLLEVSVGVDFVRDPVLEIFQFEKYLARRLPNETENNLLCANQDPCGDLLKWLLPLDNSIPPPSRPLSPPTLSSNSSIHSTSTRSNFSASSGSQLFSFGHFRSYSMSSLPANTVSSPSVTTPSSGPNTDLEDWDQFSSQKSVNSKNPWSKELLSFRGVSLEPDRFSVRCGLEGIYIPGRRWRRKIEIIKSILLQLIATQMTFSVFRLRWGLYGIFVIKFFEDAFVSFVTLDFRLLLILQNVSPAHAPDIVIYLDAITVVFEEVSKGGPHISLPFACIEAGNGHRLPNLALRRGEEHSFIVKPATSMWKTTKGHIERNQSSYSQVLTLQASNLTSEDLTLTVLAPALFTSPPSVVSLNSYPLTPMSPFVGHSELAGKMNGERGSSATQRLTAASLVLENQRHNGGGAVPISDVLPSTDLGCTHLWLQSRVPLGCVPSQSTATIKLELLPLTDGIITLDSLQVDVKEQDVMDKWRQWLVTAFMSVGLLFSGCRGFFAIEDSGRLER